MNDRDALDEKLLATFDGKVVRKDLLHRIKKGTNVPTFVLEFLLARYCASDDPAEMAAGMEAVLATLQDNYVRPDEANAAQSRVATKGKHRFIDKVHVRYVEKEKRHWAALENFNSQRIAIGERVLAPAFHARAVTGGERGHLVAEEQLGIAAVPDLAFAALEREDAAEPLARRLHSGGDLLRRRVMKAAAAIAVEGATRRIGEERAIGSDAIGKGHGMARRA